MRPCSRYDAAVTDHPPTLPLDPSPPALVEDGRDNFGTYGSPIPRINPLDSTVRGGLRGRLERSARNLGMKEWEAFQLGNDDWFVLGAVYNAKVVALVQVIVVHKPTGTIRRWEKRVPPTRVRVARGLDGTRSTGRAGEFSLTVGNEVSDGRLTVDASHPGDGPLPALELHGVGHCGPDRAHHLVICHPFSDDRALYSDKCMMPFSGAMRIGAEVIDFDEGRSFMILDDHHGEYPSPQKYDWVTSARRTSDGGLEGFNLTANQVRDPSVHNENAVWIDNRVFRLPAVRFDRPAGVHGTWRVSDADGQVDVEFTPTVRSEMHVGPRRLLAEYYAPYGWFRGRITTGEGHTLGLDGWFGVGEQKFIRL